MEIKNVQKQKGFTLVEIAIVLVIIGLLLGGVLKGQELITNAKIKAVTSDFDNISAAYYAYQDRTGNIAGDGTNATPRVYDAVITNPLFWFDLRTEGFISGAPVDGVADVGPTHSLDGIWSAVPGAATGALFTKNHICAAGVTDAYAQGMDKKMDDGNALTGTIRSGTDAAPTTLAAYTTTGVLVTVCKEL
ncbi:prepilin-type N-terminal cleavage/methylation domain-containing protein [Thiomicrorhabdus arctica]|uniref:prepilin-type N-terminal cleavage/methylation domain-containing protein n=1 Tax=Thiomicrorhabdus arctica TaxID=131540 RepID=UPI0003684771|nr:prepilin-type N-terminal cleavage/methylation domain-containing protein [Thiomicrorhabdus arctica]